MADDRISDIPDMMKAVRSIAVAGVSSHKSKFGSAAYRELKKLGYRVWAIHPTMSTFEGDPCYPSPSELPETPDCVVLSLAPASALEVVRATAQKGIPRAWFQRGPDFSEAIAEAQRLGLTTVSGRCILMYAEPVGSIHRVHRFFAKLFGNY